MLYDRIVVLLLRASCGTMFTRVKKIGAYEYLYLVENAREGGRHVQRVIKALGRREEVEASGLIDGLIASAARHSRRSIVLSSFYRGELPELRRVYRHRQPLFGAVSIAFFDTTSLWFDGAGGETLGQHGHSKDYHGHLKQVVLGIVLDNGDRPIASLRMPGNTADVTMLLPVIKRLRQRFRIGGACIVADRGMISAIPSLPSKPRRSSKSLGVRERTRACRKLFRGCTYIPFGTRYNNN